MQAPLSPSNHHYVVPSPELCDWLHVMSNSLSTLKATVPQTGIHMHRLELCSEGQAADIIVTLLKMPKVIVHGIWVL